MTKLPSIADLYPHEVELKHRGQPMKVGLASVKWLESQKIMNIVDFHLEISWADDRIAILFKKKKHAKIFKDAKKEIRDGETLQS